MPAPSGQKFGLFGATKPDDSSKDGEKKTSLFGGSAPSGSLFGGAPAQTSGGLFGSKPPTGGSLFGGAPPAGAGLFASANAGSTLFNFKQGATKATEEEEKDDDDEV